MDMVCLLPFVPNTTFTHIRFFGIGKQTSHTVRHHVQTHMVDTDEIFFEQQNLRMAMGFGSVVTLRIKQCGTHSQTSCMPLHIFKPIRKVSKQMSLGFY